MQKVAGSNPGTGSYSSTFILSIQIRNFPTPLPYHIYVHCSCPILVKSAVLPKTTSLCRSIFLISLWPKCTKGCNNSIAEGTGFKLGPVTGRMLADLAQGVVPRYILADNAELGTNDNWRVNASNKLFHVACRCIVATPFRHPGFWFSLSLHVTAALPHYRVVTLSQYG